jgi:hypothetical protein
MTKQQYIEYLICTPGGNYTGYGLFSVVADSRSFRSCCC